MITYRKVEERDKERFIVMEREFYKLYDDLEINKHLKPIGTQNIPQQSIVEDFNKSLLDTYFFLAADSDGEMVGYVFAEIVDSTSHNDAYEIKSVGYIDSIYVASEFRGQGVGTELIDKAHDWFKLQDVTISTLSTRVENANALALYEKMGFHRDTKIKMWKEI